MDTRRGADGKTRQFNKCMPSNPSSRELSWKTESKHSSRPKSLFVLARASGGVSGPVSKTCDRRVRSRRDQQRVDIEVRTGTSIHLVQNAIMTLDPESIGQLDQIAT